MELKKIYDIYQYMTDDYTLFSFKGVVNSVILNALFNAIESNLKIIEPKSEKRKKIYNIVVECLQNLYHHGEQLPSDDELKNLLSKSVLLMISKKEGSYTIKSGNYVSKKNAKNLKERIEKVNKMNEIELRDYHNEILNSGTRSDKGTAGLGLIDIARKSNNRLTYEFVPINDSYEFFCLAIQL